MEEAKETLASLAAINALPWRQSTFGVGPKVPVWSAETSDVAAKVETEHGEPAHDKDEQINTEPPGVATKSVHKVREQEIVDFLRTARKTADEVRRHIKAPLEHTINILRLLWDRGIIKYDGSSYYNSERN
jgi:hypothetical protein